MEEEDVLNRHTAFDKEDYPASSFYEICCEECGGTIGYRTEKPSSLRTIIDLCPDCYKSKYEDE